MRIELFEYWVTKPFKWFGIDSQIILHSDTLLFTWIAMAALFAIVLISRRCLEKPLNPVSLIMEESIDSFCNLCIESFGYFKYEYFAFVTSLFFFTLICNLIALLPFIDEPTNDLYTTFALGIISFLYVQYHKIRSVGLLGYLKEFIEPIFIMLPLNIIGELAKVISMSFRLFGNIMGGSIVMFIAVNMLEPYKEFFIIYGIVVLALYFIVKQIINIKQYWFLNMIFKTALGLLFLIPLMQMFFGIFEGFIQAFVITMLTITYLAVGTSHSEESENYKSMQEDSSWQ